jgi:uncharacterized membrane protein
MAFYVCVLPPLVTWHQILRLAHVVGAVAWVGSGIGLLALGKSMVAAADHAGLSSIIRRGESLGPRVFIPASIVTIGTGIAMVFGQPAFRFTDLWILLGIAGIVLSGVVQGMITGPAARQYEELAARTGVDEQALDGPADRYLRGGVLDVAVLLAVVAVMVLRPGS